jgi:hypothetical protein
MYFSTKMLNYLAKKNLSGDYNKTFSEYKN